MTPPANPSPATLTLFREADAAARGRFRSGVGVVAALSGAGAAVSPGPATAGDASDNWRPFEPWLGPLKAALGSVLGAYPKVPLALS